MTLSRTPLKRTPKKRRKASSELTRCDHRTPHSNANPSRCTRVGRIIISEDERYCAAHLTEITDRLAGDIVKARDGGRCQLFDFDANPCQGVLSWCHLLPKGTYPVLRYDLENSVAGCAGHHMALDNQIVEKDEWIQHHLGPERYAALKARRRIQHGEKPKDALLRLRVCPECEHDHSWGWCPTWDCDCSNGWGRRQTG